MSKSHIAALANLVTLTQSFVVSLVFTLYLWILVGRYVSVDNLEMILGFV